MRGLLAAIVSVFCFFGVGCPASAPYPVTVSSTPSTVIPVVSSTVQEDGRRYVIKNPEMCTRARYSCKPGEEAFSDAVGCGCQSKVIDGETPPVKGCTKEYKPVCGEEVVYCIRAPCPPLRQTFANRCLAEQAKAENITEGACQN